MKKLIIILVIIFCNTKAFSKEEIRSIFGFYITVPSNFIAIQNQNVDELLKKYKDSDINKDGLKKVIEGTTSQNIEYFFLQDMRDPEKHSINIVIRKGDIKVVKSNNIRDLCSATKNEMSKMAGKTIQQYSCELTNKFRPKFQPAIFYYQDGLNAKFQIAYQIQTNAGIASFTADCNHARTCEIMKGYVSEMIRSIR